MKKSRFTDTQIMEALKRAEAGIAVPDLCRELGVSTATFYKWRAKFGGMDTSMMAKLKELEEDIRPDHPPPATVFRNGTWLQLSAQAIRPSRAPSGDQWAAVVLTLGQLGAYPLQTDLSRSPRLRRVVAPTMTPTFGYRAFDCSLRLRADVLWHEVEKLMPPDRELRIG